MITTLSEAKILLGIDDNLKDEFIKHKLKSLEIMLRNATNNKFQDTRIRTKKNLVFNSTDKTISGDDFFALGFRSGDTIEINECLLNDGLFVVSHVTDTSIIVSESLLDEKSYTLITKIVYPFDIVDGVVRLIQYDLKMGDKIGIKQESISRHSVTYYDVNSTESIEGYPATLMKFINKYKKLRWS